MEKKILIRVLGEDQEIRGDNKLDRIWPWGITNIHEKGLFHKMNCLLILLCSYFKGICIFPYSGKMEILRISHLFAGTSAFSRKEQLPWIRLG